MHNRSETLTEIVRTQELLELQRQAELRATAHALMQAHVGWNCKVVSVERSIQRLLTHFCRLDHALRQIAWAKQSLPLAEVRA